MKTLLLFLLFSTTALANDSCKLENSDSILVNTAQSLKEIEQSTIASKDQCKIFRKEFKKRRKGKSKLTNSEYDRAAVLCGKWMFINLGMKTKVGIPTKLLVALQNYEEVGPRLENLGFLVDESWEDEKWPFGIVESRHHNPLTMKKFSVAKVKQISCAGCHSGQLSDGRFSLGTPNEKLNYGKFNVYTMYSVWLVDKEKYNPKKWHPRLIEKYSKLIDKNDAFFKSIKSLETVPLNRYLISYLIGEEAPPLETQLSFLNSRPGLYNGFAPSVNFEDRQLYLSAPQIYEIGTTNEAHFGTLAGHKNIDQFLSEAYVYTTRTDKYAKEMYLKPMKEFLKCLKAPKIQKIKLEKDYALGKRVFKNNCTSCHDLNNGAGSKTVEADRMNAPNEYIELFKGYKPTETQSKKTYSVLNKLNLTNSTDRMKVRRLNGIWTRNLLTTNGQIDGLDHLLCLNKNKRISESLITTKQQNIHDDLCKNYTEQERKALKEFLLFF